MSLRTPHLHIHPFSSISLRFINVFSLELALVGPLLSLPRGRPSARSTRSRLSRRPIPIPSPSPSVRLFLRPLLSRKKQAQLITTPSTFNITNIHIRHRTAAASTATTTTTVPWSPPACTRAPGSKVRRGTPFGDDYRLPHMCCKLIPLGEHHQL